MSREYITDRTIDREDFTSVGIAAGDYEGMTSNPSLDCCHFFYRANIWLGERGQACEVNLTKVREM